MKMLLVCEHRQGKLLDTVYESESFAKKLGAERAMFVAGADAVLPAFDGTVYVADTGEAGEYDPELHAGLIVAAARAAKADAIVFAHTTYGWDTAPRAASALKWALISEIVDAANGAYEVPCFNAKMRRRVTPKTTGVVLTLQSGAFAATEARTGTPVIEHVHRQEAGPIAGRVEFIGYEEAQVKEVDLGRADVIVSVGRGIGRKENIPVIEALARALGGELGATRPVIDAGWLPHSRQVGSTGQIVSPKLYVACGISGAIQHLAGMKRSNFIAAINKDKDAPIGAIADVLVVADVMEFVPALTARLQK